MSVKEGDQIDAVTNEKVQQRQSQKQQYSSGIELDTEKRRATFNKVYRRPNLNVCKEHLFCDRQQCQLSFAPEEQNPLMQSFMAQMKRDTKKEDKSHSEYLRKPFYYRGIQNKKKQLAAGQIQPKDFEDDNIEFYGFELKKEKDQYLRENYLDEDCPGSVKWQEDSYKFAEKLKKQTQMRQAQSNRKMQPTMQQSVTNNMANIGSPNVGTAGPNSSIGLQTQQTQQIFEPSSAITKLESTFFPNAGGIMSPEPRMDRAGSIITKKGTGPSSTVGDKKDDGSEKKGNKNKCVQLEDKCCNSTYHQLKPKHQKIKQIVTLTREEQLGKQTKVIHDKSQFFLDRSIGKSMRWSFFPVVPKKTEDPTEEEFLYKKKFGGNAVNQRLAHLKEQHEQEYMNGQTFYKTNTSFMAQDTRKSIKSVKVDQSLDSKEATATLERTKSLMSGTQGAQAHGSMPNIAGATGEVPDNNSPPKRKYAQEREQNKANQELQERISKEWEFKRAQQLQKENKDFLFKMHYRHVGQIEKNNEYANTAGIAGPKITKVKDFSDVIEASSLNILTQAELDEANLLYGGLKRENMLGYLTDKANKQAQSPNLQQQQLLNQQKRFLEQDNLENIKQCKNILQNQKLYAETILVNAKTGKQLKSSSSFYNAGSSRAKNFRGSKSTGGRAGKTTFQQYQDPLFSATSNQQIASILNQSKRYQISQMKEEFGIMAYIKKKYYQENLQGKGDILEDPKLLEDIKNKYFKDITDEEFTRARIEEQLEAEQNQEDNPSAKNDQSQVPENQDQMSKQLVMTVQKRIGYVKDNTREIYENILRNNEGLNFRQGRVKPYQFEDENFISNQMIGKEAVDLEQTNARNNQKKENEEQNRNEAVIRSNNSTQVDATNANIGVVSEENSYSQISPLKKREKIINGARNQTNQASFYTNDSITTDDDFKKLSAINQLGHPLMIDEKNTNVEDSQNESAKHTTRRSAMQSEQQSNDPAESAKRQQHAPNSVFYNKNYKETKSVQHVYLDSDYWYHKGVVLTGMNENDYALNCYRQALLLKQDHEPSIFNLACSYEKLRQYDDALKSFTAAIECRENWPDAHYGLALCCLKLKRNQEAVNHIENAKKWSIEEYENKVRQRNKRRRQRQKEMLEAINLGNAQPPMKTGDDNSSSNQNSQNNMLDNAELCPEDDDSQDEFYIDPATQKNGGVSTHIMYVRALCHREIKAYRVALESYAKVMKREAEICDYEKMIERVNFQQLTLKAVEGPCSIGWKVDLYSHFKRLKLLKENNPIMMVDLRQYYTWKDGWDHDKIPDVIKKLQFIRFFNRFDSETLYQMMKKTDLKVIKKHNLLFLEPNQCAIVINGNLNLFSHKDEVATPILQAIYTPGDIIGNSSIDNGWSRETHSWIIAYKDCDIVIINIEYVNYLWDKMKSSSDLNYMATKIKASKCFEGMTEQSIYTIAFDVMYYQRFDNSEQNCKICPQYTKSHWNVDFIKKQNRARKNFADKMMQNQNTEFRDAFQIFQKEKYPRVEEMMKKRYAMKEYHDELLKELNRREFKYGKKKKKKTIQEEQDAESLKEKEKPQENNDEDGENAEEEEKFDKRKLNLPRFDQIPTKEELEEEKEIRKRREPKYGEMVDLSEEMEKICQGLKTVGVKLTQQLEDYKHAKDNYPKDANGFFILLEGQITIKNDYNEKKVGGNPVDLYGGQPTTEQKFSRHGDKTATQKSDRPEQMDVFGAEKFLQVQGYTYYGCAYSTTEKKDGGTVCGFLRDDLLYLIPFYDLYRLKTDIEKRYQNRCERLKKVCSDKYNPILKKENL